MYEIRPVKPQVVTGNTVVLATQSNMNRKEEILLKRIQWIKPMNKREKETKQLFQMKVQCF